MLTSSSATANVLLQVFQGVGDSGVTAADTTACREKPTCLRVCINGDFQGYCLFGFVWLCLLRFKAQLAQRILKNKEFHIERCI